MYIQDKLVKPWVIVAVSVTASVLIYTALIFLLDLQEPLIGLAIATGAPLIVSLPIALIIDRYIKRIHKQNKVLDDLDHTNKRLFYLLSHDLRSPIASQKSLIEMLLSQDLDQESGRQMLEEMGHKTSNLLDFLNDVLAWAQKQQGEQKLEPQYFSSSEILKPLVDLYRDAAQRKGILIKLEAIEEHVYADKDSYSFIFRNILHNAIKFTPTGGEIKVHTVREADRVHTVVHDNGIGIDQEKIQALREGTARFSTKGTADESGTGFGISACLEYLKMNQGELQIDSRPGQGSRFSIVLPAQESA